MNLKSVVLAVAVAIGVLGGTAWAAQTVVSIVGPDGTIHGCYAQRNGALRVVAEGTACKAGELPIQWNQRAPSLGSLGGIPCDTGSLDKPDGRTHVTVAESGLMTFVCKSSSTNPVLTVALAAGPERCTSFPVPVCTNVRFSLGEVDATGAPVANGFTCLDPHTRSTFPVTCHTQRFAGSATVRLEPFAALGFVPSWSGCDSVSGGGVCTLTLTQARTVTVTPVAG